MICRPPGGTTALLERALAGGDVDVMPLVRYDLEVPGRPGTFEERYWTAVNAPAAPARTARPPT